MIMFVRCSYVREMISSELQGLLAMLVELLTDIHASRTALLAASRRHNDDLLRAITVISASSSSLSLSRHWFWLHTRFLFKRAIFRDDQSSGLVCQRLLIWLIDIQLTVAKCQNTKGKFISLFAFTFYIFIFILYKTKIDCGIGYEKRAGQSRSAYGCTINYPCKRKFVQIEQCQQLGETTYKAYFALGRCRDLSHMRLDTYLAREGNESTCVIKRKNETAYLETNVGRFLIADTIWL